MKQAPTLRLALKPSPSLLLFVALSHGLGLAILPLLDIHWIIQGCLAVWIIAVGFINGRRYKLAGQVLFWRGGHWFMGHRGEEWALSLSQPPLLLPLLIILHFSHYDERGRCHNLCLVIAKDGAEPRGWRHLQRLLRYGQALVQMEAN